MNDKDTESFNQYVLDNPDYYFGLEKIRKEHDLKVWKAALEWERSRLNSSNSDYCDTCGARYEYWTR